MRAQVQALARMRAARDAFRVQRRGAVVLQAAWRSARCRTALRRRSAKAACAEAIAFMWGRHAWLACNRAIIFMLGLRCAPNPGSFPPSPNVVCAAFNK